MARRWARVQTAADLFAEVMNVTRAALDTYAAAYAVEAGRD